METLRDPVVLDPSIAANSGCKSTLHSVRDILRKGNTEVLLYRQDARR